MNSLSKKIKFNISPGQKHWVGNGFNVHNMLRPTEELYEFTSPFLLMDYAPPMKFSPSDNRKGVGEHPHRGFETVTFAIQGSVEHRDSAGGGGIIEPGDVQWMTAGSGVVHDEFHSDDFSKSGGIFEMIQLWVNLPAKHKMTEPKYQSVKKSEFPIYQLNKNDTLKVVAGEYKNEVGPCTTYTPINVYSLNLSGEENKDKSIELKSETNTVVLVIDGSIKLSGKKYDKGQLLVLEREGDSLDFEVSEKTNLLVLNSSPVDEPVVAHGPFVMNTKEEIYQAILDYQSGEMGVLK
jgi:redox-sensitive bicupin YhaK (pirin superfamily)